MSTSKRKKVDIFKIDNRLEFEKEVLHFAFIHHIKEHMKGMRNYQIAKKLGVSSSFVSQLFSGDKILSIELIVKFQRALGIKFEVHLYQQAQSVPIRDLGVVTHKISDLSGSGLGWNPFQQSSNYTTSVFVN